MAVVTGVISIVERTQVEVDLVPLAEDHVILQEEAGGSVEDGDELCEQLKDDEDGNGQEEALDQSEEEETV